jgi:YidC/Oxa1 family membrane protein insertase
VSVQATKQMRIDPKRLRRSVLIWVLAGAAVLLVTRVGWSTIWHEGLIRPMLNVVLFLYTYLGRSFVIAITALTLVLRLATMPLQIKQVRASRKMAAVQPLMAELQKKYGGDKERLVQEQQKLYREAGVSPLGGCLPTLVQFPIWIGLYQSINSILPDTPLELMNLGKNVYAGFKPIIDILPLQSRFLWLNLATPDPTPFVLPVLVAGTMWLQQKLMTQPGGDPQQASMNQTMQLMMPLMFGYFTMQFSSGLALYFVISNVIGIALQWGIERFEGPVVLAGANASAAAASKEKVANGKQKSRKAKR